jgi:hypothetical protein
MQEGEDGAVLRFDHHRRLLGSISLLPPWPSWWVGYYVGAAGCSAPYEHRLPHPPLPACPTAASIYAAALLHDKLLLLDTTARRETSPRPSSSRTPSHWKTLPPTAAARPPPPTRYTHMDAVVAGGEPWRRLGFRGEQEKGREEEVGVDGIGPTLALSP